MDIESDHYRLKVSGSAFIQESESLVLALKELLLSDEPEIQISLEHVEAIDTGMLQVFISAQKSAEHLGKSLLFSPISAQVKSILEQTGLDPLFYYEGV